MKLFYYLLLTSLLLFSACSDNDNESDPNDPIKSENILDYVKDSIFKQYLIDQIFHGKTTVTREEAAEVTDMSISHLKITSLNGIEFFTALTQLNCADNQLTNLDVSKNIALYYFYCDNNNLTNLDVSKNTILCFFNCSNNPSENIAKSVKILSSTLNNTENFKPTKGDICYDMIN